ncbi:MAG: hypothetical protein H8E55_33380 [Pelagibacterales bacterium]|nr:hypothetical protein [Pelagibacterales bacterium]|tara:strand:+ start:1229 stop:1426 length:198 start_codon:yes stop_codon:yes gene_type:complete
MGKKRKKKNKKAKKINENKGIDNTAKASSSPTAKSNKGLAIKPMYIILVIVIAVLAYVYLYSGLI